MIGNPLSLWMARRGLKAVTVADSLGLSQSALSHIMTGRRRASPLVQQAIASLTNYSVTPNDFNAYYAARDAAKRRGVKPGRKKTAA
jgi:transcriptional regulator with XRE-family HTH domain